MVTASEDLADALARGRLTLGDLSGIQARERNALYALAVKKLESGQFEVARTMADGLLVLFPYESRWWRLLGIAYQRLRNPRQALQAYRQALVLEPRDPWSLAYRGECAAEIGNTHLARSTLETALAAMPTDALAVRIRTILARLPSAPPQPSQQPPSPGKTPHETVFRTRQGQDLPLPQSRFPPPQRAASTAATAPGTAPHPSSAEATATAVVPKPQAEAIRNAKPRLGMRGRVVCSDGITVVGGESTVPKSSTEEATLTAVMRRLRGQSLESIE